MITSFLKTFAAIIIPMTILDGIWLTVIAKPFYGSRIGHLFAEHPNWPAIVIFYTMYAAALAYFVIVPAISGGLAWYAVLVRAALFGLIAYGTYDLTNQATLRDWPIIVTLVDMAWGMFVTAAAGIVAYLIVK